MNKTELSYERLSNFLSFLEATDNIPNETYVSLLEDLEVLFDKAWSYDDLCK